MPEKKKTVSPRQLARQNRIKARERFKRVHLAEKKFARQLKQVAHHVGHIVKGMAPNGKVTDLVQLTAVLRRYSDLLKPWAASVVKKFLEEINIRDLRAWHGLGQEIGRGLRAEVASAPIGSDMRKILDQQVVLITSLPLDAAQRVHELTIKAMSTGVRAKETAKEILKTGHVTASRAMLIARTETTRTATAMVESRARFIGSEGYIWRTAKDTDVRERHKHLEGKFIKWDSPPIAGEHGERAHAGAIYNCRCYPEPIIPDEV